MVVLGQWPYHHSITLDQMKKCTGVCMYYWVDEDMIVPYDKVLDLQKKGYIVEDKFFTVMSTSIKEHIDMYSEQNFMPIEQSLIKKISDNNNQEYISLIEKVKSSALVMIVNNQSTDIMEDIGAIWNSSLGVWVISATALKILREKRKQKHGSKITMKQERGGVLIEIRGDVTAHVDLLESVKGKYNETYDVWHVPISAYDKIKHICS